MYTRKSYEMTEILLKSHRANMESDAVVLVDLANFYILNVNLIEQCGCLNVTLTVIRCSIKGEKKW